MKRPFCVLVFGLILFAGSTAGYADSSPIISGQVHGIELCPQFICGAAIFAGQFQGQIGDNNNANALLVAALTHDELPSIGNTAAITGGVWELRTWTHRIRGVVIAGGLFNNGDNTFRVRAMLLITSGGGGIVIFRGILNHNTLVPTFGGSLTQD